MKHYTTILGFLLVLAGGAAAMPAQGTDPREKVRRLAEKIAREMQEIDKLLLQNTRAGGQEAADRLDRTVDELKKLLEETGRSQGQVIEGIDELIETIEQMPSSGGGQGEPQQQDQQQSGEQRPQGEREQTETPDFQDRGQQQPQGEQQDGTADGPRDSRDPGRNRLDGERREDETERVLRPEDIEAWGNLPPYIQSLQNRGGMPQVPERYRKLLEAYIKQKSERSDRGGR